MAHQYDATGTDKAAGHKPSMPVPSRGLSPAEVAMLDQMPDAVRQSLSHEELSERLRNLVQLDAMCQGLSPDAASPYRKLIDRELNRRGVKTKPKTAKQRAQLAEKAKLAASLRGRLERATGMAPLEAAGLYAVLDDLEREIRKLT